MSSFARLLLILGVGLALASTGCTIHWVVPVVETAQAGTEQVEDPCETDSGAACEEEAVTEDDEEAATERVATERARRTGQGSDTAETDESRQAREADEAEAVARTAAARAERVGRNEEDEAVERTASAREARTRGAADEPEPAEEEPADEPLEEDPVAEEPVEEPEAGEPEDEEPADEEPADEEPELEEPVEEDPAADEPADEEPELEEPVEEDPAADEPADEEPAEEQPEDEEPAEEEPADDEPADEPAADDPEEDEDAPARPAPRGPAGRPDYGDRRVMVPPGHYPPEGMCRVWYEGQPPGRQPASAPCDDLLATPLAPGAFVLYNGLDWDLEHDWETVEVRRPGAVPTTVLQLRRSFAAPRHVNVPSGQHPRDGLCRIWTEGVPPGRQGNAVPCETLADVELDGDEFLLYDGTSWAAAYDWQGAAEQNPGSVPDVVLMILGS